MIKIDKNNIYNENYGWLDTYHHFSFANYYDPDNKGFGSIRVINDDIVSSGRGFDTHPHKDMEIITYIVEGEVSHKDSSGNEKTIGVGEVQYMSAGSGIYHSEHNKSNDDTRLLQIWIHPDKVGYPPLYKDYRYDRKELENNFYHLVSGIDGKGLIKIRQDADIFVGIFDRDTIFNIPKGRKVYGIVIQGSIEIEGDLLETRDAFKEEESREIKIKVKKESHIILFQSR